MSGRRRVQRGGAFWNDARKCRSAYRNRNDPDRDDDDHGFRLCVAPPSPRSDPVDS